MKSMDEEQIQLQLEAFVKAWEEEDVFVLDQCVSDEPHLYFSMFGKCYEKTTLKKWIKISGDSVKRRIMQIDNHSAVMKGDRAEQYAVLLGVFVSDDSEKPQYLSFGGTFVNTLIKEDGIWKFETIRFELQSDNGVLDEILSDEGFISIEEGPGNRELIKGWKQVNDRVGYYMDSLKEQGDHVILAEFDAPWFKITKPDNVLSDESQIQELFAKYAFAYDFSLFVLMRDIFTQDARIQICGIGGMGCQEALACMKLIRQGAPRSLTTGHVTSLECHGETAECRIVRDLPEALRLTSGSSITRNLDFSCGEYYFKARKEEGIWKIYHFEYKEMENWKSLVMRSR
ncbi:nuclear transport factor 2 family protein [Hungatella sp.]|uniref:nuclear transport factor 2 family protein n=1 Tax=Hungatella sp. TaxID=2613924 RepID=UPI002A7F0853|nr:nuclear transport factor 2 family protein [Hungatella sp.]